MIANADELFWDLVLQRIAVALSCVVLWLLAAPRAELALTLEYALFTFACALAGVEKLASMMNTIAVEKDWVRRSCYSFYSD